MEKEGVKRQNSSKCSTVSGETCDCRLFDDVDFYKAREYRPSPGFLALEDWRRNPFIWLHYVQSNDGSQLADFVLSDRMREEQVVCLMYKHAHNNTVPYMQCNGSPGRLQEPTNWKMLPSTLADDTSHWSIHDVQRYFCGQLHCENVLFPCQYPNLRLPTLLGRHSWRTHAAHKRPPATYLKELHRSLVIDLKKMEIEEAQMDRLIVYDQLIKINLMDHHRRKMFFSSLLNILSFQDNLQLVSFENLRSTRLEGVRLVQQLACFNSHSLKYLFLWYFVKEDENPLLVNYSYISGSGEYILRPDTSQCFLRSLGELRNLRVLALEYGYVADGTGSALMFLLPVLKRPHFRLELLCVEPHIPGRADPSLGGGGNGIPDYAWRRVAIACPDLFLAMVFYRLRDYDHARRFLTCSIPLREVHLHQGIRLDCEDFDTDSFVRCIANYYASTLVTLSITQRRNATFALRRTLERMPSLVRFHCVGAVNEKDLRDMLVLIACGICYNLKEVKVLVDMGGNNSIPILLSNLYEEYKDVMQLLDIEFCLKLF